MQKKHIIGEPAPAGMLAQARGFQPPGSHDAQFPI
jgi:hypothetical protein